MTLFDHIRAGDLTAVKAQIEANPTLAGAQDPTGYTALILATYSQQMEVARYLLEQGAAVDQRDAAGNTALMGVCFKGFTDLARLLLEHGADVNARNANDATPLIYEIGRASCRERV